MTTPVKKPKTDDLSPRSTIYNEDPSKGMALEDVYEKLMDQLKKLIDSGRNGGALIATQTVERLSQTVDSKKEDGYDSFDDDIEFPSTVNRGNSPCIDETFTDLKPKQLKEDERPFDADVAEIDVVQSDPKYGVSYVVRYFWKILYRVLSRDTGIHGENAVEFWGDALRTFYWLISMSGTKLYF